MNTRIASTGLVLSLALASVASADVLWDQSAIDINAPISYANRVTSSVPFGFGNQREAFGVADITVPAGGWTINSISVYMANYAIYVFNPASTAVLNIFSRTGPSPLASDNPRRPANGGAGVIYTATTTTFSFGGQDIDQVTVSGLSITLAPGDYWIGLTPIYSGGSNGQPSQWPAATQIGLNQFYRGANQSTMDAGWTDNAVAGGLTHGDGAMLITGVPTPGAAGLLGLAGLAAVRRRRSV